MCSHCLTEVRRLSYLLFSSPCSTWISSFVDGNGDASRDELEMACMDFHREQLSIEHSMQDLDSAVGRLDNILMSLYVVIAALVIAVCLVYFLFP